MSEAKGYVDADYLDAVAQLLAPAKLRSYELMHLAAGQRVLDLGCGPGTDTLALSARVGESGEVHGADRDAQMVARANDRARAAGLAARVMHRQADATALPWPDQHFDACRSERLFQHLAQPDRAFVEMVRVTRRGGWIVVVDADWASFTIDSDEPELERRLVRFHVEHSMHNPFSGRMLRRMFRGHGLQGLVMEVVPIVMTDCALARRMLRLDQIAEAARAAGAFDEHELSRWQASLARAASADSFFASTNGVTLAGRKP